MHFFDETIHPELAGATPNQFAETCRWTNCNEDCAAGFEEMPRVKSSKVGEILSEHTQCNGHGRSKFCCPAGTWKNTQCDWKGLNFEGTCDPGCFKSLSFENEDIEVGRTTAGRTRKGYQSLCCLRASSRLISASIEAYGQCGWYSS